jgi:hypothetical protein
MTAQAAAQLADTATYGWVILILMLVTDLGILQSIFDPVPMARQQWFICFGVALIFLIVGEIVKLILRMFGVGSEEDLGLGRQVRLV